MADSDRLAPEPDGMGRFRANEAAAARIAPSFRGCTVEEALRTMDSHGVSAYLEICRSSAEVDSARSQKRRESRIIVLIQDGVISEVF
jgi:hypothetical protein